MRERTRTTAALSVIAVLTLGCAICGPAVTPPPTDSCSSPQAGNVTQVELATPRLDPSSFATDTAQDELPPRLLRAGDMLWQIQGGQGASMVPVRLVFRGADVPSCLAQDTQVTVGGRLAARNRDSVATYPLEAGARATKTFWLPGAFEREATLTTDSVGMKPSLAVRTAPLDECEAANACPCANALKCSCATGLTDAGLRLWAARNACLSACDAGPACEADGGPCSAARRACADDAY